MTRTADGWSEEEFGELRKVYFTQAFDLVEDLQDDLLRLESDDAAPELIKNVKRMVHTLKGDSNSMGFEAVGTLCHRMEDALAALAVEAGQTDREATAVLLAVVDAVRSLLTEYEAGRTPDRPAEIHRRIEDLIERTGAGEGPEGTVKDCRGQGSSEGRRSGRRVYDIDAFVHPQCAEPGAAALMLAKRLEDKGTVLGMPQDGAAENTAGPRRARITYATVLSPADVKQQSLIPGIIEAVDVRERAAESAGTAGRAATPKSETLRVDAAKIDTIINLVGELIISRSMIEQAARELVSGASPDEVGTRLSSVNAALDRTVSDLQKDVLKLRMVPVHQVFRKFPRMVRDLAKEKKKRVRVVLHGSETELDKGIVDSLGEPLAHLVRNFIDHGIEPPGERRAAGKEEEGVITIAAYHEGSQIVIEASDDGRGIDANRLRQKAVETGFLSPGEAGALSDAQAVNLIFLSGLSTASEVSATSGRGIGMDAVKSAVEGLKGSVEVETAAGTGTRIRLRLPLTLAVIQTLLFSVGRQLYAMPSAAIIEVARVLTDELVTVGNGKTFLLRDQVISIISAEELFRTAGDGARRKNVLVLGVGAKKAGLLVDRLAGQQELVIKAVDDGIVQSEYVAGASILGSGQVVLILDAQALFAKAVALEKSRRAVAPGKRSA